MELKVTLFLFIAVIGAMLILYLIVSGLSYEEPPCDSYDTDSRKKQPSETEKSLLYFKSQHHFFNNRRVYIDFFNEKMPKGRISNLSREDYILHLYLNLKQSPKWSNISYNYSDYSDKLHTEHLFNYWNPNHTPFEDQFVRPYDEFRYTYGRYDNQYYSEYRQQQQQQQQQQQKQTYTKPDLTAKYCKWLDLERTTDFPIIKSAYKVKIKKNHPDKFTNAPAHIYKQAVENTKKINEAYTYLETQYGK